MPPSKSRGSRTYSWDLIIGVIMCHITIYKQI